MKRMILVSVLVLVLSVAFVPVSNAQMAKEGTVLCTVTWTVTLPEPAIDLDGPEKQERYASMWDLLGVILSDNGEGPFHNMSMRYIGLSSNHKGENEKVLAYGVWTDLDGDTVFAELKMEQKGKSNHILLGGTGKFAGIKGSTETVESTDVGLMPSKEGTISSTSRQKLQYKLP